MKSPKPLFVRSIPLISYSTQGNIGIFNENQEMMQHTTIIVEVAPYFLENLFIQKRQ